jgi:hypothetical protein
LKVWKVSMRAWGRDLALYKLVEGPTKFSEEDPLILVVFRGGVE